VFFGGNNRGFDPFGMALLWALLMARGRQPSGSPGLRFPVGPVEGGASPGGGAPGGSPLGGPRSPFGSVRVDPEPARRRAAARDDRADADFEVQLGASQRRDAAEAARERSAENARRRAENQAELEALDRELERLWRFRRR
jgi:hypothetical protein